MTQAAALLLVLAVVLAAAPGALRVRRWVVRRPRAALGVWLAAVLGGIALLGASLCCVIGAAARAGTSRGGLASATVVAAWCGLAVLGALTCLVATRYEPVAGASRRSAWQLQLLVARHAEEWRDVGGVPVVVVPTEEPVAFGATDADGPRVVVSHGLVAALAADELRAVIEHERAHLRGRHAMVLRLATVNRSCFPAYAGARRFDASVRLLVELLADDVAARRCGSAVVARALDRMAELTGDPSVSDRAERVRVLSSPTRTRAAAWSWRRRGSMTTPSPRPR